MLASTQNEEQSHPFAEFDCGDARETDTCTTIAIQQSAQAHSLFLSSRLSNRIGSKLANAIDGEPQLEEEEDEK